MPNYTKPYGDFTNNVDVADATKVNSQINQLFTAINGGLDSYNVPTLGYTITGISANTVLTTSQVGIIECTGGANGITATLPSAVTTGLRFILKKVDSGVGIITINTNSSQTIDGVMVRTLNNQYSELEVISNGSNWDVLVENIIDRPTFAMSAQALIGNFDVWQRGTSLTNPTVGAYLADRFLISYNYDGGTPPTNVIHSRQELTSGDIFGSKYFYRINPDGAGSSFGVNASYGLFQRIENGTQKLCGLGKKVTVSFWARSSIAGKRIGIALSQRYGTGGSPTAAETITGQIITLTSTWTRYTLTLTTNTLVGKTFGTNNDDYLQISIYQAWGTTIATLQFGGGTTESFVGAGNIDIAQVQLCAGDVALPFQPRSTVEELQLCQRYYEKSYDYATAPGTATSVGYNLIGVASNADNVTANISYKVRKRIDPTVTYYHNDGTSGAVGKTISDTKVTGVSTIINSEIGVGQINKAAGFTLGDVVMALWTADAEL